MDHTSIEEQSLKSLVTTFLTRSKLMQHRMQKYGHGVVKETRDKKSIITRAIRYHFYIKVIMAFILGYMCWLGRWMGIGSPLALGIRQCRHGVLSVDLARKKPLSVMKERRSYSKPEFPPPERSGPLGVFNDKWRLLTVQVISEVSFLRWLAIRVE